MKLTSQERAASAQLLMASLDDATEDDEAWEIEVERRSPMRKAVLHLTFQWLMHWRRFART